MKSAIVVGAGVAGVAACFALRTNGVQVTLIDAGPGASAQTCGAADWQSWLLGPPVQPVLPAELHGPWREFVARLGVWTDQAQDAEIGTVGLSGGHVERPLVASQEGVIRQCCLRDRHVFDLRLARGKTVGVALGDRRAAEHRLAGLLNDQPWSRATNTRFVAWLGSTHCDALLMASGLKAAPAASLHRGELLSPPKGLAGPRLRHAGLDLVARLEATVVQQRAVELTDAPSGVVVVARDARGGPAQHERPAHERALKHSAGAVVLAVGGLIGGGLQLEAGGRSGASLACSLIGSAGGYAASSRGIDPVESLDEWLGVVSYRQASLSEAAQAIPGWSARVRLCGEALPRSPRALLASAASGLSAGWALAAAIAEDD